MKIKNVLAVIFVAIATYCLIVFFVAPNSRRHRRTGSTNKCINNLRQLDGAKQQWALEHQKKRTDVPAWADICPYVGRGAGDNPGCETNLHCPEGGKYHLGKLDELPTCSLGRSDPWHRLPN